MTVYENYLIDQSISLSGMLTLESRVPHIGNVAALLYYACTEDFNSLAISVLDKEQGSESSRYEVYIKTATRLVDTYLELLFAKNS
jgi:hypothetical protein